jgi:hypothetical protein
MAYNSACPVQKLHDAHSPLSVLARLATGCDVVHGVAPQVVHTVYSIPTFCDMAAVSALLPHCAAKHIVRESKLTIFTLCIIAILPVVRSQLSFVARKLPATPILSTQRRYEFVVQAATTRSLAGSQPIRLIYRSFPAAVTPAPDIPSAFSIYVQVMPVAQNNQPPVPRTNRVGFYYSGCRCSFDHPTFKNKIQLHRS